MKEFLKTHKSAVIWFFVIAVATHLEGNIAMIAGEVTAVWAAVRLVRALIYGVSWLLRRDSDRLQRLKKASAGFVLMAILSAVSWQGIQFIHWRIKHDFAPLIERLEAYHAEHGEYPKTTEAFFGLVEHLPKCGIIPFSYSYHSRDGNSYLCSGESAGKCRVGPNNNISPEYSEFFDLTCMTFGFNHHSYSSKSGKWGDWD